MGQPAGNLAHIQAGLVMIRHAAFTQTQGHVEIEFYGGGQVFALALPPENAVAWGGALARAGAAMLAGSANRTQEKTDER